MQTFRNVLHFSPSNDSLESHALRRWVLCLMSTLTTEILAVGTPIYCSQMLLGNPFEYGKNEKIYILY